MRRVVAACLSVLATTACSAAHRDAPAAYTVRDSAGIRIVRYPGPFPSAPAVTFAAKPVFRYGDAEGEHAFQSILTGALQPDGGAVVVDRGTQEVVVLGPDGTLRSVLARPGEGPDEVRYVMSVQVLGQDTILVEDDGNARFMLFENGRLARSVSVGDDYSLARGLLTLGVDSAGGLLMWTSSFRTDFKEPWFKGSLVRFDLDTHTADTVGRYDMAPRQPANGHFNPFGPFGSVAGSGGRFLYGRTDVAQLTWVTSGGKPIQMLRWNPVPTYPDESDLDAYATNLRADLIRVNPRMPPARMETFLKEQRERLDFVPGEPRPFFSRLFGDGNGRVWVGAFFIRGAPDAPRHFTVIAPDGTFVGTAELPDHFRLLAVRGHLALGVLRDDMDVQSVAVFPFTVGGGAAK